MPYDATVYKVMIASPSDVILERNIIREVLLEWNIVNSDTRKIVLLPIGWETHASPTMGDRPQGILNKQILKDCDLLVGVFWTRVGTATGEYVSGTVEEIEEHIKAGKPVMLYFSNVPVVMDSVDQSQYSELNKFKDSCKSRGIFENYTDSNEFKNKFYRQLQIRINQDKHFKKEILSQDESTVIVESKIPNIPGLSREAQILLKEASQDKSGLILRRDSVMNLLIKTNGKQFVDENNPRTRAKWESALNELENNGLIFSREGKRVIFEVTRKGFEIGDLINL